MAPTLYLLCGLPGSGKTTRAKELEASGRGMLLNADDWVCRVYPDDAEAAARDERKGVVERLQWELVERLLGRGISVILDWGLWTRAERDHYRERARTLGADVRRSSSMHRWRYSTSVWPGAISISRQGPSTSRPPNSTRGRHDSRHRPGTS